MYYRHHLYLLLVLLFFITAGQAFVPPNKPPTDSSRLFADGGQHFDHSDHLLWDTFLPHNYNQTTKLHLRGGNVEDVVKGTQTTLSTSANFWKTALTNATRTLTFPFRTLTRRTKRALRSKEQKQQEELLMKLQTMPVKRVIVPNSTVLPDSVVQIAAKRSALLGQPLQHKTVQDLAQSIQRWYHRKGYILHSVTGATLVPETATAEIAVQEPKSASNPVGITFCKEMVQDDDGTLLTVRQYKDKHTSRRTFGFDQNKMSRNDLNLTLVPTTGWTNPLRIAQALGLRPGHHFEWHGDRWQHIARSGIFRQVVQASPRTMPDGTVQFHIVATEAPPRHLEYGVGKSLYTGSWEGELEFEHTNLLGGGESLGVSVRRGTKDKTPSVHVKYTDDHFGMEGGYDVEVFRDYIGDQKQKEEGEEKAHSSYDHDDLLDRKGTTLRLRNPIDPAVVRHSVASVSMERTTATDGSHENIGSVTIGVGPFAKYLPYDARSNIDAAVTFGTTACKREKEDLNEETPLHQQFKFQPYTSVTTTARQIFPLFASTNSNKRSLILALRHSATASSRNLPRHELRALGNTHNIRGATPNGRVSTALRGTTELRVPIQLPRIRTEQDASLVVFGDWVYSSPDLLSSFERKTSIGLGLRKSIQGLPLQYDVSYTNDGKLKATFGLGRDFDV